MNCPESLRSLRVALVHDYLNQNGGAERVVEVFTEMFPKAPVFTSVYDAGAMPDRWRSVDIRTSFMQRISPAMRVAKALLPLYPTAFESFDLRNYDLVLSSTTAFAKGVLTRPETCHVCYCNSPSRFLWAYDEYVEFEHFPRVALRVLPWLATPLRMWDFQAAQRVDYFVAGSHNAARRIAKYYRRESDVLQPPVETDRFTTSADVHAFFLVVSRLQPYKRIDLAVEACTRLNLPLHVIGDGPDRSRLERLAGGSVRFFGRVADEEVRRQMSVCRALLFPGEEDFGLTPVEVQASGRPVVAYGAGGALETVRDGETGVYFRPQSVEALCSCLLTLEDHFDSSVLRAHARQFDVDVFKKRMYDLLARRYHEYQSRSLSFAQKANDRATSSGPDASL